MKWIVKFTFVMYKTDYCTHIKSSEFKNYYNDRFNLHKFHILSKPISQFFQQWPRLIREHTEFMIKQCSGLFVNIVCLLSPDSVFRPVGMELKFFE